MGITAGTVINAADFRTKLYNWLNSILPDGGYQSTSSLPWGIYSSYLTTKAATINTVMSLYDTNVSGKIATDKKIYSSHVFAAMQTVFGYIKGHVKKVYWDDLGSAAPGDQRTPYTRATQLTSAGIGTWTYFAQSFSFNSTGLNYKPTVADNGSKNENGIGWYPDTSTGWNGDKRMGTYSSNNLTVGTVIKMVNGVDTMFTNFYNEWVYVNSTQNWWGGGTAATDATRILAVKYWCHSNCHSSCHGNCHGSRSRR